MRLAGLASWALSFITLLFSAFVSLPAQAQIPHETLYFEGLPTTELVALWSTLPGKRSFVIHASDVYGDELKPLAQLQGADRVLVEVDHYPSANPEALAQWRKLAGQGVEFVLLGYQAGLPTESEIDLLNQAAFARCTFVISYLPGPEEAARLSRLDCKLSLTFAVRAYPKFGDKEGLAAVPEQVPLLFSTDYWPSYTHMDTFNLLPHRKRLRISDSLPTDESLPYLKNIQRLDDLQLSTRFDPSAADWAKFQGIPLSWSSQGHVPSQEALTAFLSLGQSAHRLIVDSDQPWTADEKLRIECSPLPVEWIHSAPWGEL